MSYSLSVAAQRGLRLTIDSDKLTISGCPVTFGVKNIGQVQKYRFFEVKNIG